MSDSTDRARRLAETAVQALLDELAGTQRTDRDDRRGVGAARGSAGPTQSVPADDLGVPRERVSGWGGTGS
jgi:hypothetical protein